MVACTLSPHEPWADRAQSSGGAREHLPWRMGRKVHLHDGHQAGMKPDWKGVYRPRAASSITACSGAAGPGNRPSQDEQADCCSATWPGHTNIVSPGRKGGLSSRG